MSTEPTMVEVIQAALDNALRDLFTGVVARVEGYKPGPPGPPTVDVLPVVQRPIETVDGAIVHEDLPIIRNVPVVFPQAGSMSMTWPLAKGDHVFLMCTNWSHQQWRVTGEVAQAGDLRTHELGNAFAIAGIKPQTGTLPTDATAVVIEVADVLKVGVAASDFVAMNQKVLDEIAALHDSVKAHNHMDSLSAPTGPAAWVVPTNEYDPSADVASTKLKSE